MGGPHPFTQSLHWQAAKHYCDVFEIECLTFKAFRFMQIEVGGIIQHPAGTLNYITE